MSFWLEFKLFGHRCRSYGLSRRQENEGVFRTAGFEILLPFLATREVALFARHNLPRMYDVEDHQC